MAQWLRLHTPNAGDPGSIPAEGTRSHIHAATKSSHATTKELVSHNLGACEPQLKRPPAATKTWHNQNKQIKNKKKKDRKTQCSILPNLFLSHHVHSQDGMNWDIHKYSTFTTLAPYTLYPAYSSPRCQPYIVSLFLALLYLFDLTLSLIFLSF